MKTLELARLLLDQAPHHSIAAEVDGFECPIVDVCTGGHGSAVIDCDLPEGYRLLPDEPTESMIDACAMLDYPAAHLRLMWATMIRAHDAENE